MKITWHDFVLWLIAATGIITGLLMFATALPYERNSRTVALIALSAGISAAISLIALDRAKR